MKLYQNHQGDDVVNNIIVPVTERLPILIIRDQSGDWTGWEEFGDDHDLGRPEPQVPTKEVVGQTPVHIVMSRRGFLFYELN